MDGVCVYIHDILVSGSSEEAHLQKLDEVLHRLKEAGICLKKEKCRFRMSKVEYLGHQITSQRLLNITREGSGYQNGPNAEEICRVENILGSRELLWKITSESAKYIEPTLQAVEKGSGIKMELRTRGSCEASKEDV